MTKVESAMRAKSATMPNDRSIPAKAPIQYWNSPEEGVDPTYKEEHCQSRSPNKSPSGKRSSNADRSSTQAEETEHDNLTLRRSA